MTLESLRDLATEHDADRAYDNHLADLDERAAYDALRDAAEQGAETIRALLRASQTEPLLLPILADNLAAWRGTLATMSQQDAPELAGDFLAWADGLAAGEPLEAVA
jgi:hypothetical protein